MIELKGSLETATLEKIVKKSCGYWISPDVEAGKLSDTVTAGSMVVMVLDECAEGEDVYDEYEDGYMDVSAGFLLPPLRRVLQCQSASSQRIEIGQVLATKDGREGCARGSHLVKDLDTLHAEKATESLE